MRRIRLSFLTFGSILLLTACDPSFEAGEKSNKAAIESGKEEVSTRLALASEQAGDLAAAEREYQQLVKSSGGAKDTIIQLAAFYTRNGKSARAAALLEPVHKNAPQDMDVLRAYANSLIGAGDSEQALSLLDSAIASHSSEAYLYNSRGVALDRLGKYREAQQSYRRAIALRPEEEMDFKTNLGMSLILAGDVNDAIELLQPLKDNRDISPQARQNLALAYGLQGDMDAAMKIGSKDLSIREMNENVRFYQLMAKNTASRKHASVKDDSTALVPDVFPVMPTPPQGEVKASPAIITAKPLADSADESKPSASPMLAMQPPVPEKAKTLPALLTPPATKNPAPQTTIPEASLNPSAGSSDAKAQQTTATTDEEDAPSEDNQESTQGNRTTLFGNAASLPVPVLRPQW